MSATKLERSKQFIADKQEDRIASEGEDALVQYHDHEALLALKVLDQDPPDISPWIGYALPSPPANSREDLALRLYNRERQLENAQKRNAELEAELRGLHERMFTVLFPTETNPRVPDFDSTGAGHDPRIHTRNRSKGIDGKWKMRRDLSAYVVETLTAWSTRYPRVIPDDPMVKP
ncbi:MAG TPA: hypothetical protein VN325_33445 [Steroidobacteraceae bacterium]|nr:hypothetical protein [Steroidobacteraceae bacterium]